MASISLCMIVRNEEDTIDRCLESVKDIVDEIVIVDTGSTDRTQEIARIYTDLVYQFQWIDDFSAARNFAFSKATMDYQFWLDADDYLLETDRNKFLALKSMMEPNTDVVMMRYNAAFDSNGHVILSYMRERLFKRVSKFRWEDPVHEYIQPAGEILESDICITHGKLHPTPSDRNLGIYRKMLAEGKTLSPRAQLYYALELFYSGAYAEAAQGFQDYLNAGRGWLEDNIKAGYFLGKSLLALGDKRGALDVLCRTFADDLPRAEVCGEIGYLYKSLGQWDKAIFWFDLATRLEKPKNSWGFFYEDYWGFIPWIELCVCYFYQGNREKASECHRRAAQIKPDNPAVQFNRQFFAEED